jgi:hypothetical protein
MRRFLTLVLILLLTPIPITAQQGVLLSGNVSGTTTNVTVNASIPAGTNNIGDVDIASIAAGDNNIGNVDVLTLPNVTNAGTFAVQESGAALTALQVIDNLVLAEDGVHSSGEPGVLALVVRNDAQAALAADGDRIPLSVNSQGALYVTGGGGGTEYTEGDTDATITGHALLWEDTGNTLRTISAATPMPVTCPDCSGTGVSDVDDSSFTVGSDDLVPVGYLVDETTPDSADEGDVGIARMSANRIAYGIIRDAAGNERGANVNASGQLSVTGPVTNAGTFAVQVDGAALTALQLIDDIVYVDEVTFTATTSKIAGIGAVFDDASSNTMDEDEIGSLRMTAARALHVSVQNASLAVTATNLDVQSGGADLATEATAAAILTSTNFAAAFGTAGTADTQVMSVQGIASMTPLLVNPGTAASWGVHAEDSAHSSTHAGVQVLAVRQDSQVDFGADGDYVPLSINDAGELRVAFAGAAGGTSLADDADFTDGTTPGTPIGGVAESASPSTVTEGDFGWVAITLNRAMKVTLFDTSGNALTPAQDWTISSAIGTTGPGQILEAKDFDGSALPQTASAAEGDAIPAAGSLFGITYTMLVNEDGSLQYGTSTTPLVVDISAADTLATVTTVSTVTTLSQFAGNAINLGAGTIGTGTLRVTLATDDDVSDMATLVEANMVAHDAADAGNPLKVGAVAETSIAGVTLVADADRTNLYAGIDGVLIVRPQANLEDRVSAVVGVTDGSSTSLVASQGAGLKFCATTLVVSNSSATNVTVDLRDGTGGSVLMTIPAAANMGGAVIPLQVPLCTSDATALAMDPSAAATTVTVTAIGFKTNL